uniref:UPAR/Ly6 domain-containing protein n=1 Tax=Phocoena sinus TaxID=42100 RepID=A0A8C9C659_PHOSS
MDKSLLLLLGVLPFVLFQGVASDTLCMVCQNFKKGQCLRGKGSCTMEQGPGCRTRDFFIFSEKDGWRLNHTELDCYDYCSSSNFYFGDLKISTFCCKGRDFCNKYYGKGKE